MTWSGTIHRQSTWYRSAAWTVLFLACAAPAMAQFERATISGTIKDQQGGVMPGVTVTVTNTQTQQPSTTVTDGSGFYTFPNLLPGRYDIAAEIQGFKKVSRQNVPLDAAGAIVLDFTLQTGAISEEITVTADVAPLQTDVAIRKTVEAKDIELLSFSGRNPIGVVGLKAGVIGGSFNTFGFSNLGNGGFNINGSRPDENNITIDGATAIRTRSSGAIVGIQNVDAIQEVQVLTADYLPEYGRASGGQIRFVTKSGSNHYSGSGSYFLRDDKLQANTWSRNRSTNPLLSSGPAPFKYKQYSYSLGGPVPGPIFTNRLFFFGAQEWVDYRAVATNTAVVPTEAMRRGDFSELLNPSNPFFFGKVTTITNPLTGQPFDGNRIPANQLSPNGLALLNLYPPPTPGFLQGRDNAIFTSDNPQNQRKDNIRFDYRLNDSNQLTFRYSKYNWTAIDAFRGTFPFARTDWDRPNSTQTMSWTSTIRNNLVNEFTYTHSLDQVFINVFTGTELYKRSRTGVTYPYIFPAFKEIPDKIPTVTIDNFSSLDGGPYPSSSQGPIHTFYDAATWIKGRHTMKAGVVVEYSGEDDFDQINVQTTIVGGTNNQNGGFLFRDSRDYGQGGTGLAIANAAMGLFSNYAEIGQRAFTPWRSLATDVFVQDSWKPASNLTIEGGVRWVYWPPWYSQTNNIANFEPQFYNPATAAVIDPKTGRITGGDRYDGIVLPGSGFKGDGQKLVAAQDPAVLALFRNQSEGFSQTYANAFEPRFGLAYSVTDKTILRASAGVFHNRVTLNDSTLLGGNPPFQPQVSVSNGNADNPGALGALNLPLSMTAQDLVFKHPTAYTWATGVQREIPFGFVLDVTYVGRLGRNLQRERNINQLLVPGTRQANPGVNIAALRPYLGFGPIRMSENAGRSRYNSLQIGADRRYANGLKVGAAYTLSKSLDNASDKRNVLWNAYDDSIYWGSSNFDRRHVFTFYYIYDLPFWKDQNTLLKNLAGGWQISGASFFRTGTPFSVTRPDDVAGVGDSFDQPYNLVGDPLAGANRQFSAGAGNDQNFWFNTAAFQRPAQGTFGNAPRNLTYNPGEQQWDIALFKNFALRGTQKLQFRAEMFNFPNHPNWSGAATNPIDTTTFGRITTKSDTRRDMQLSLRYQF